MALYILHIFLLLMVTYFPPIVRGADVLNLGTGSKKNEE